MGLGWELGRRLGVPTEDSPDPEALHHPTYAIRDASLSPLPIWRTLALPTFSASGWCGPY